MMYTFLAIYFCLTFAFTLGFGFLQAQAGDETSSRHSTAAVFLMCVQAVVSVAALGGDVLFPAAALWLAITLLAHHTVIHWNSRFEDETCSCAPFQCKDVQNHETWVVASLVAGAVSLANL
jgi:hypothetical protein